MNNSFLATLANTADEYKLTSDRAFESVKAVSIVVDKDGKYHGCEKFEGLMPRAVWAGQDKQRARFLIEYPSTVLNSGGRDSQHAAYKEQIKAAIAGTKSPGVKAVLAFLSNMPARAKVQKDLVDLLGKTDAAKTLITFAMYGRKGNEPILDAKVNRWWRQEFDRQIKQRFSQSDKRFCQVSGKRDIIPYCSPFPVRGWGALISAKPKAFEYGGYPGLESAHVGLTAAVRASLALEHISLNKLTFKGKAKQTRFAFDSHSILSWFCRPSEVSQSEEEALVASIVGVSQDDDGEFWTHIEWIKARYSGCRQASQSPDPNLAFCTMLTESNMGRMVVHNYVLLTMGDLYKDIVDWTEHQKVIVGGKHRKLLSVKRTMRLLSESNVPSHVYRDVHQAFFEGHSLRRYLPRITRRVIRDISTGYLRKGFYMPWEILSLMKLSLIRTGVDMPEQWSIEKAQSDPAYALGSLLYLTAYAQDPQNKGRESVIPGRYLLSCSSRPLEVIHSMQHYFEIYMKRMRRDSVGLAFYLQRARDLLMSFAQDVPKTLTFEQSAQLAFGFAAMREAVHCYKLPEIFPNLNGANHGEEDDTN